MRQNLSDNEVWINTYQNNTKCKCYQTKLGFLQARLEPTFVLMRDKKPTTLTMSWCHKQTLEQRKYSDINHSDWMLQDIAASFNQSEYIISEWLYSRTSID